MQDLLGREGWRVNHKAIRHVWREEGLRVPQHRRKRRRTGDSTSGITRMQCARKNDVWSMDFIFDRTVDGRQVKIFAIIDEYTRECLSLNVSRHFQACDVVVVLDELLARRGAPAHLRSDNGPEFVARAVSNWCKECKTVALFIEPGAPWQNAFVESFNSRIRDELLSSEVFESLAEATYLVGRWRDDYNRQRPQRALGKRTPAEFAAACDEAASFRLASLASTAPPREMKGPTSIEQYS